MREMFLKIKERIDSAQNILLTSHVEPDGDALGSMLALRIALQNLGKSVDVFCVSKIPENLGLLPGAGELRREIDFGYDLIIGLDYGDCGRLETAALGLPLPEITFDHHPYINQSGLFKIVDPVASSTCEIVYEFLSAGGFEINKEIAVCLLSGIFDDTWNLRHPNATARTFKVAGELLKKGVALNKVIKISGKGNTFVKTKAWGRGLASIEFDQETGLVFCFLSHNDLAEKNISHRDLSGLSSFISHVPEARFSLVLTEIAPGRLDGSLRTHPGRGIDVSKIAGVFGGGGHRLSAGFKTNLKMEEVFETIRNLIKAGY